MSVTTPPRTTSLTGAARTRIVLPGTITAAAAAAATTLIAVAAKAIGVDFQVNQGGDSIPLSAFPVSTFVLSLLGVAGAVALQRWGRRPATTFVRIAVALTVLSLAPPVFSGADGATSLSLVAAHLAAAAIVIPVLARRLAGERR